MSSFSSGSPSMRLRALTGRSNINALPLPGVNTSDTSGGDNRTEVEPSTAARNNTPDTIHQAKQDATAASDAALGATANATADPVPAMLKAAIAMPAPAPSLAPLGQREGSSNS